MSRLIAFVDTHVHPYIIMEKEYNVNKKPINLDYIIHNAKINNVNKIICIATDEKDSRSNINLAMQYNELYAAIGIHPCDVCAHHFSVQIDSFVEYAKNVKNDTQKCVAIGEIGLDFYHKKDTALAQEYAFRKQIESALLLNLPIIIHSRNAADEVLKIVDEYSGQGLTGVVHCFSEGVDYAREWIARRFALGVGGTVTYPANDKLRQAILSIGLEHILFETDAPYLPPQSLRGKINTPSNILIIAEYVSSMFGVSLLDCSEIVLKTTYKLFPAMRD